MPGRPKKITTKPTRDALGAVDGLAIAVAELHESWVEFITTKKPTEGQRLSIAGQSTRAVEAMRIIMASLIEVAAIVDPIAHAEAAA